MFTGKVAVVTGGSRGIGLAIARALLERGARVAITATSDATLRTGAAELALVAALPEDASLVASATAPEKVSTAGSVLPIRADVRRREQVEQAIETAARHFGGLDVLVNNAGVGVFAPVADMTDDEWHRVIDTNLTGVFYGCRAVLPHLRSRGGGWIINISSLAGTNAFPDAAAYCASKAALNAFSEALMQEVRHDGVRVAYVMPGSVRTDFTPSPSGPEDWKLVPDDVAQVVADLIGHPSRSLPSRVEIRPSQPPRKKR